jgi:hypothetical protein
LVLGGLFLSGGTGRVTPSPSAAASATADLAARLHRPLRIPPLGPSGACPVTPIGLTLESLGQFQGNGPVRVNNLNDVPIYELPYKDGWYGQKVFWAVDAREPGPILVRVVRLDGQGEVGLGTGLTPELMLANEQGANSPVGTAPPYPVQRTFVDGVSFREPGCYLMQMDGVSTTSTVVFRVVHEGHVAPGPSPSPSPPGWAALAARPLVLPAYSGSCSEGPAVTPAAAFPRALGSTRVFLVADPPLPFGLGPTQKNPDGTWPVKSIWVVTGAGTAPYPKPVIVRGALMHGVGQVQFEGGEEWRKGEGPVMYLAGASGIYSEGLPSTWQEWVGYVDYPGPGCYVFQVDGDSFSEQFTVEVVP